MLGGGTTNNEIILSFRGKVIKYWNLQNKQNYRKAVLVWLTVIVKFERYRL